MTECKNRTWCQWPVLPVKQHCNVTKCVHCCKSVPIVTWPWMFSGSKTSKKLFNKGTNARATSRLRLLWLLRLLWYTRADEPIANLLQDQVTQLETVCCCWYSVYLSEPEICQRRSTGLPAILKLWFDTLCNVKFDYCCITYSTERVELREWLLLYNVQHQSLWCMQIEASVA